MIARSSQFANPNGSRLQRPRPRRAYILVAVLGLTAVVTALGMAYLEENSTSMPEAANRLAATRARYLAESGVELGMHYLVYPPTAVSPGSYWTGGTHIAIDKTNDFTNVTVARDLDDLDIYLIRALGVAHDPDGSVRGKKRVQARIIKPGQTKWRIPSAVAGTSPMALNVPPTVEIQGDLHSNGDLSGQGWCDGRLTAVGTAAWSGGGPPVSQTSAVPSFTAPPADPAAYATYKIGDTTYSAYNYSSGNIDAATAATLNATDMSATNPGRVIVVRAGTFTMTSGVQIAGTLVVDGDLRFHEAAEVTAMPNFPALVVRGNIVADRSTGAGLTVAGSIICSGALDDGGRNAVTVNLTGACLLGGGFAIAMTDGVYRLKWDAQRSVFWDFSDLATGDPITVLNWKED